MDEHRAEYRADDPTTDPPRHAERPPTRQERRRAATRRRRLVILAVVPIVVAALVSTIAAAPVTTTSTPFDASDEEIVADVQQYWSATMPEVYGRQYRAIPADRLFPYSRSNPPPGCGTRGLTPYAEVAGNAFYCGAGDFVAWDEQELFPRLTEQYGAFAPALVLAHEWGHAIQARVGFETRLTVYMEQQADCFAGAWAAHVASDASSLSISEDDLDRALAGMLGLSDPVGVDGSQSGAHGNGFDRVSAFQDGFEGGAAVCAGYETDPPSVTESGFTSQADYVSGGDMALDDLVPALETALDGYWSGATDGDLEAPELVPVSGAGAGSCRGDSDDGVLVDSVVYCAATNSVLYDPATLREAHSSVGDFAAGLLLAAGWSSAVQHDQGRAIDTPAARRVSECLTGSFTGSLAGPTRRSASADEITLSPGDLDEVVTMLVGVDAGTERDRAFDRVTAFRTGYFGGAAACTTRSPR